MSKITCFKAYDVRGQLGTQVTEDVFYRIGRAFGEYLKAKTIVIGGDIRKTSPVLKTAVSNGLTDEGIDVIDLGLTGTEEVYFATTYLGVDGGIEITASHNPIDYNGMKLVKRDARPIGADTGLDDIRCIAERGDFKAPIQKGTYRKTTLLPEYIDHLMTYIHLDNINRPLKLVINSGNGAAGHVVDALEERFLKASAPIEIIKIHNEPDGNFPNGIPNPLLPENRADTIKSVLKHEADIGIAFDGDFDRCFFFDEKGSFVEGYYVCGLLAEAFLQKKPGSKIVYDPRLTWNTIECVSEAGGVPVQSKSGHSYMKDTMRKVDAIYGGELSAHHYFKDFSYCDSGMIPWLLVSELLSVKDQPLSKLIESYLKKYPSSGEINLTLINPQKAIQKTLGRYKDKALNIDKTDGIGIEFEKWRFNLRTSNTEPVIRLNVETKANTLLLKEKTEEILKFIKKF